MSFSMPRKGKMKTKNNEEKEFVMLTDDVLFKATFGYPKNISFLEDLLESYYGYEKGMLKGKLKVEYEQEFFFIK